MTRVNADIPVILLSDQHLLSEHREIKRIPNTFFTGIIPNKFKLNKGHVLFFSNKPNFTFKRYMKLYNECLRRGFDVTYYGDNWKKYSIDSDDNAIEYHQSKIDVRAIIDRIRERVYTSNKTPRYFSKDMGKLEYCNMLENYYETLEY